MQQPPPQQGVYPQQQGYPMQQPQQQPPYQQGQPQYPQPYAPAPTGTVPQPAQYMATAAPVQATTVYQPTQPQSQTWDSYNGNASRILGWIQVGVGIVCFLFTCIGIGIQKYRVSGDVNDAYHVGGGIWCSVFFFISGGLAIGAATNKTTCMIVGNMVMSIVTSLFGFTLLGTAAAIVGVENTPYSHYYPYGTRVGDGYYKASLAMGVIMLLGSLLVIIVSIVMSGYCCAAVCCGRRQQNRTMQVVQGGNIQYVTTSVPGTQTVVVAGGQPVQMVQPQAVPAYNPAAVQSQPPAYMQQPGYQPQMAATSPVAPPPYKE